MRCLASLSLTLVVAGMLGCPLPPDLLTCEEANACETSSGSEASGTGDPGPGVHTSTGDSTGPDGTGTEGGDDSTTTGSTSAPDDTTASTGDASTTGMAAFCGDGIVNQDSEECDDGMPSADGPCSPLCKRERIIFVLGILVQGKLSGLQGADAYCRSQAFNAKEADPTSPIKEPKNFKALLPSSTESIFDRHFHGEGRYRLINGLTVSDSFDQLFTNPLQTAIDVDEFGQTHDTCVWTASTADGQPYPGIDFCGDWTIIMKGSASYGRSDRTDAWWIESPYGNPTTDCADECALYCVEQ